LHRDYSFEIGYTVSPGAPANLTNGKEVYLEGDTVVIDIRLNNSGQVQNVVVSTLIKRY